MGIAMMEPSLPIWMNKVMGAEEWEQGNPFSSRLTNLGNFNEQY